MARRLPSKPSLPTDPCPSGQWPSRHASHRHAHSCLHALFGEVPFASPVLDLRATPLLSCLVIIVQSCRRRTQDPPPPAGGPRPVEAVWVQAQSPQASSWAGSTAGTQCREEGGMKTFRQACGKYNLSPPLPLFAGSLTPQPPPRCAYASGWNKLQNLSNMPTPFPLLHRDYTHLQCRDLGSIPGSGRSPGEGNGSPYSTLAWKIPWKEKPGRLQSMGWQRVGHH